MPFLTILGTLVGAGLAFLWVVLKVRQDEDAFRARHRPPTEPPVS